MKILPFIAALWFACASGLAEPLPLRVEAGHLWPTTTETQTVCLPAHERRFKWEGNSSTVTISHDEQTVTVSFRWDVIGPDWLMVELSDTGKTLMLHGYRLSGSERTKDFWGYWDSWDQLLSDPGDAAMVARACFRRAGVNSKLEVVHQ